MKNKKSVEINGKILTCTTGYSAIIQTNDGKLKTSVVKSICIVQNNLYFETENTNYIVRNL